MVISANIKTTMKVLMVAFVAAEYGGIGRRSGRKTGVLCEKTNGLFLSLGRPLLRVRFADAGPALGLPAPLDLRLG
jgi:hypothetical protein